MTKSAQELWNETRLLFRNRYRQDYLDHMVQIVAQARVEGDSYILASALMCCAHWMMSADRSEEALQFLEQRLEPAVWHEDKLEIRCVRDFIKTIKAELAAKESRDGKDRDPR